MPDLRALMPGGFHDDMIGVVAFSAVFMIVCGLLLLLYRGALALLQ